MRKILYAFLLIGIAWGCAKEDSIEPKLELHNLYVITGNSTDSVQKRIFQIYEKYNVPVYFNDTIAKEFLKINVYGDTVWRYETVDMAWTFSGNEGRTYSYGYMTDPAEQMFALDVIEKFLSDVGEALYPYSIFVADSAVATNAQGSTIWNGGAFSVGYKTLLMTGNWEEEKEFVLEKLPFEIVKSSLQKKIVNYEAQLEYFYGASNASWYDKGWVGLTAINDYNFFTLLETYWENYWYDDYWGDWPNHTIFNGKEYYFPDELELARNDLRAVMGRYGFVNGSTISGMSGMNTPQNTSADLENFINEILNHPDDFETLWGSSPLVMEKYEILMNIIEGEMGVYLRNDETGTN